MQGEALPVPVCWGAWIFYVLRCGFQNSSVAHALLHYDFRAFNHRCVGGSDIFLGALNSWFRLRFLLNFSIEWAVSVVSLVWSTTIAMIFSTIILLIFLKISFACKSPQMTRVDCSMFLYDQMLTNTALGQVLYTAFLWQFFEGVDCYIWRAFLPS